MKKLALLLLSSMLSLPALPAVAGAGDFSLGVIARSSDNLTEDATLHKALAQSDADNLAFVVVDGIKSAGESCNDSTYDRRKSMFEGAKNGIIPSLAASDWIDCKNTDGRSSAMERLHRLRDLFFSDEFSFGASKLPVIRQSVTAKFRSYGENARWEFGNILFATVNLPANNNHYLPDAGRNSEFEDRAIANRDWLQRVFTFAARKKMDGIVLFSDGDPLLIPTSIQLSNLGGRRDGFAEIRKQLLELATKFNGKLLIVHSDPRAKNPVPAEIAWRNNIGELAVESRWVKLNVTFSGTTLFSVSRDLAEAKNTHQ